MMASLRGMTGGGRLAESYTTETGRSNDVNTYGCVILEEKVAV